MRGKSVDISECNYPVVDMHKNKKIQKRAEEEMKKYEQKASTRKITVAGMKLSPIKSYTIE